MWYLFFWEEGVDWILIWLDGVIYNKNIVCFYYMLKFFFVIIVVNGFIYDCVNWFLVKERVIKWILFYWKESIKNDNKGELFWIYW